METGRQEEHLNQVEEVVSGNLVDSGPDHLTVHDIAAGEDVTLRIDDRTQYEWLEARDTGRLTDNANLRVGYFIAGGVHVAAEVIVLEPGDGVSLADRIPRQVH
ncbi:hypothetical protein DRW03_31995 [Corallococcus sp. H22C18031201]|uniref:hypothetical protein n=1 Tax=Citreicoccus inhibens TaxID=2849499 RepID=UPI000E743DBD|nr:hypothetical protein [Citreicoccus inhibens]MBU8898644.1 hypothetical protein [Citreicoccus inhibens]RJS15989.1 hypothetical protein DRW03_31995 [Corallococcus sp. H22C18031201]